MNQKLTINDMSGEWKRIEGQGITEFDEILNILNGYYNAFSDDSKKTPVALFREFFPQVNINNKKLYVKKTGEYEYIVFGYISDNHCDSWLHVDGIQQERDILTQKGQMKHPVFSINCLADIYDKATGILKREVA